LWAEFYGNIKSYIEMNNNIKLPPISVITKKLAPKRSSQAQIIIKAAIINSGMHFEVVRGDSLG
jgi:hypothetical protein